MNKICAGVLLLLSLFFCQNLKAARFWIAATPSNWNNTANWSTISGGAGGASVPGVADDINFDGMGLGSCTIEIAASVKSITVATLYSGTISQGGNSITTVSGQFFRRTYYMQIQGTDYGLFGAVSDLRLTLINSVVGTAGVNAGTNANPQVNRTGLATYTLTKTVIISR